VLRTDPDQVGSELGRGDRRQHGHAVLVALAAADEDLAAREVDIFDASRVSDLSPCAPVGASRRSSAPHLPTDGRTTELAAASPAWTTVSSM
jgi:hypothetical protein